MQGNLMSSELAQKALDLLNEAESLEKEGDWVKVIEKYKLAVDCLEKSGYLTHRVQDIYDRITEINKYIKQEQLYRTQTQTSQIQQLEDEAFSLLDVAKKLELEGSFKDSIQQFMEAIRLFVKAGWSETQLENLKSKIINLTTSLEQQNEILSSQQEILMPVRSQIEPEKSSTQIDTEHKIKALEAYEVIKKKEEETQDIAFAHIDKAKEFEKNKKFDDALKEYQKSIELLNSIGWVQQTENLQTIIKNLEKERANYESIQIQLKQPQDYDFIQEEIRKLKAQHEKQKVEQQSKLKEYKVRKISIEALRDEGLNLIDEGNRNVRFKKFNKAYDCFNKAISNFKEIGWDTQAQYIKIEIENAKKLEIKYKQEELEIKRLQDELVAQQDYEKKRRIAEDLKMKQRIREVGAYAEEISSLIEIQKKELKLSEQEKLNQIKREAKDFSRDMGKMIQIKQELLEEMEKIKEDEKRKNEKIQNAKSREEVDEISRMLKEVANKEKKK